MPDDCNPGRRSSATPRGEDQAAGESDDTLRGIRRSSSLQDSAFQRRRSSPAHFPAREREARAIIIFVTICTHGRRPLLANRTAAGLIIDAWQKADRWRIGRYVMMPDHLHFFCAPASLCAHPLKLWLSYWRNDVTRRWPRLDDRPIWQADFWDRQLRREESYAQKWDYDG